MKKSNIIFTTLLLTLTATPSVIFAQTISGTVKDTTGEPLIGATVRAIDLNNQNLKNENTNIATITDTDGKFTLAIPDNAQLKITYIGFEDKIVGQNENFNDIILKENALTINEVEIRGTIKEGTECDGESLKDKYANKAKKGKYHKVGENWVCIPNECIQDYRVEGNVCVKYQCSTAEKESVLKSGAKGAKWDGTKCVPSQCDTDNGYTENANNECVLTNCTKAQLQGLKKQQGVADGKLKNGTCVPICKKNYHLNGSTCEENKCPTDEEDWNGKECIKVKCSPDDLAAINAKYGDWDATNNKCIATYCEEDKNFRLESGKCICKDPYTLQNGACINKQKLEELQKAYDDAKAKEQSTENKLLGGLTTAATGIGGMQLMQGLAEQSSDKDAAADMAAYIETMRCTYGDGKQVKAGPEEIELPGANDSELMKLRSEYLALAADLKERKEALGLKPGIESEVIVDRTQTGLYDNENVGITGGNYASLYRAQALNNEADQAKIAAQQKTSANRVTGGAIAAGAGVVGGILGNELINGKLGEKLKEKNQGKALRAAVKIEKDALEDMKKCLKDAGVKDTDSMEFQNFYISVLSVKNINCKREITKINGETPSNIAAKTIFADSNDANKIYNQLIKSFDPTIAGKMIGVTLSQQPTDVQKQNAINTLKSGIDKVTKRFQDAAKEDEKRLSSSGLKDFDIDFSSILSSFKGDSASSSIMDMVNNGF